MTASLRDDRRALQIRGLTEVSRALTYAISFDEVFQLTVKRAAQLCESQGHGTHARRRVMTMRASVGAVPPDAALVHTANDDLVEQLQLGLRTPIFGDDFNWDRSSQAGERASRRSDFP